MPASSRPLRGVWRNGIPQLPPAHYSFGTVSIHDRAKVLAAECVSLQSIPGLKNSDRESLQGTILTRLVRPPSEYGDSVRLQIESDLRGNSPAIKAAFVKQLTGKFSTNTNSVNIEVEETQERVLHIKHNLAKVLAIDQPEANKIVEKSVHAIVSANHRIADMQAYSSLTGFAEDDAQILFAKLSGIFSTINPRPIEDNFRRLVTIADLPHFSPFAKVDVDQLLKLRESPECQDFRTWMRRLENASDAEISEMVASLRNRVGVMLKSTTGKALRFVTTSAAGFVPSAGPIVGIGLSAIDTFLIDRLFPLAGPLAFLTKNYPSLFETADDGTFE